MLNKFKLNKIMGLGLILFPILSLAVTTNTATPSSTNSTSTTNTSTPAKTPNEGASQSVTEMPKDTWLEKIKTVISEPICKGFMEDASIAARLKERNIDLQACIGLIPAITEKCQKKYYNDIPAMINKESASKWGRSIGECIGGDFAMSYLYPSANSTAPAKKAQ